MRPLPAGLPPGPFLTATGLDAGLTRKMLRGHRFRRLFKDVWILAAEPLTLATWTRAALLVLPPDAAVSHLTAIHARGIDIGPSWPLHFSTNTAAQTSLPGITLHRRRGTLSPRPLGGIPVLGPDRTFVDVALLLGLIDLVTVGDWLLHAQHTDLATLQAYCHERHLDGVLRARRAVGLVRERSESPQETRLRLMAVFARLPEPEPNRPIHRNDGLHVARSDLVYRLYLVVVEYDGDHHRRDPLQRQRDRERREALEAEGWRVIVVTKEDMRFPHQVVLRIYRALTLGGYSGSRPVFSTQWERWFAR